MYLTNQQLITQRKETWGTTQQLWTLLEVVLWLVKKYGSTAFGERIQSLIGNEDANLSALMNLLKIIGKNSEKSVRSLLWEVWWGEIASGLSISSPHVTKIAEKIWWEQHNVQESQKLELTVSWDWKIYKRGLDRDLDALLK